MSDQLPSGPDQKQQYKALTNEIADILLGPDSPVRGTAEFDELIVEHDRLQSRQAELKTLDAKLVEVLPGLEQAEAQLAVAQKKLAAEKKKLAGFAGELGKAAFAGLRAGELPDHPLFADRKELQSRVESLQKQKAELLAGENAGMLEKAKVQAQRLKLTGQIKVEELKIGSLDRALGTALLTSKEKPPVQCGQSEEVLKAIADQRKQVVTAREQVKQAEVTLAGQKSAAVETLKRSTVNNADSLKSELKEVRKEHRQNEKAITSIRDSAIATALAADSLHDDTTVGEKLKQLWSLNFDLDSNKNRGMKLVDESVSRFKRLPTKVKYGAYSAAGIALLLLFMNFFGGGKDGGELLFSEEEIVEATKEEISEEEIVEATEEEVTEAIAAITALGGKAERDTFGGVFGIMDDDTVDSDLKTLNGLTGLTSLEICFADITDVGLVHLKSLTGLVSLSLGATEITDAGLVHLKELTGLKELDLHNTEITDAGLVHLKGLTGLKGLGLINTKITDAGLVHLKELTGLEYLRFYGTEITDAGLVHLKGLTGLKELDLSSTEITDAGLVHLKGLTG